MTSTALFVEILLIGALADVWIIIFLLGLVSSNAIQVASTIESISKVSNILVFPFVGFTYSIGWVINFSSERLFKPVFQKKYREELFNSIGTSYDDARGLFFQKASNNVVEDLRLDRHVFRITRSNMLNFLMLSISMTLHIEKSILWVPTGIIIALLLSTISFFHWRTSFRSSYRKIFDTYKVIKGEVDNKSKNSLKKETMGLSKVRPEKKQ